MKYALLFALSVALIGCGGQAVQQSHSSTAKTFTAAQAFPLAANQHWTMQDQFGNKTYFDIRQRPAAQGCDSGEMLDMFISKDATDSYWGYGIPGGQIHFVLKHENGTWRNVTQNYFWNYDATMQPVPQSGKALPYVILPASIAVGEVQDVDTAYTVLQVAGDHSGECLTTGATQNVTWKTHADVQTLADYGQVVVVSYLEGDAPAETWYFAPGIGLVRIARVISSSLTIDLRRVTG